MSEELVASRLPSFAADKPQDHLLSQSLSALDVSSLHALTPEVISRQATINIGLIGHVAHGKSTVVKALSGAKTQRHVIEQKQNKTIKLGYANAKIFKCSNPACSDPECYKSVPSHEADAQICSLCSNPMQLIRHVSFVDTPGHDMLMATMLTGAAVMDAAILLVAANEKCPQPQTAEHMAAMEIMKLDNIVIVQNKIDLVKEDDARAHYEQIRSFTRGSSAAHVPIIPLCAQLNYNVDYLAKTIAEAIPVPQRDFTLPPLMSIVRSFDVNRPGSGYDMLKGGIAGGTLLQGVLRKGQEVEVRPGIIRQRPNGELVCIPIRTRITSLFAEANELEYAVPGGLIGVGTNIDPTLTRADRLCGQVLGSVGQLPNVYNEIEIEFHLLDRLLGIKDTDKVSSKIENLKKGENLRVNIGPTTTGALVKAVRDSKARIVLQLPVCMNMGDKLAISRRVANSVRMIGWGVAKSGEPMKLYSYDALTN